MKINILFCENVGELPIEIDDIDEYESVRFVKVSLDKKCATNGKFTKENFYLIYQNIILNNDKIIKFYKVRENDNIRIGKLEDFLQGNEFKDHVILELFLVGSIRSLMHLIVKKSYSISEIKLMLNEIILNINNIWDISDIDRDGRYHKLIINCDNTSVGENIHTYGDCCDIYDKYLIRNYLKKHSLICWHKENLAKENLKVELKGQIQKLREIIKNEKIDSKLNYKISMMPKSFVNSRFLFSMDMADRIIIICDDYWNEAFHVSKYAFRDYFLASLHVAIADYSESSQSSDVDKSIKDIVLDALDYFMNYLNDDKDDWRYLMKLFLDKFLFGQYDESQIKEIFESYSLSQNCNPSVYVKINQEAYRMEIPVESQKVNQIKRAISIEIKEPMEKLYFIKCGESTKLSDDEIIKRNDLPNCVIEIVSNMDNIKIVNRFEEGAYGKIFLCQDQLTAKNFLMKMPKKDEDLHNEISIQNRIRDSLHIKTYIGLICYKNCICMAMEYMSNRSLISYLKKEGCLHEAIIAKLSHQILSQIKDIHKVKIIHRDIKGDNIVLDEQNKVTLIDFGLAVCTECLSCEEHLNRYEFGTLGYIAPELFEVKIYTNKVDIWSFGVVVIEMINGKRINQVVGIMGANNKELKIKTPKPLTEKLIKFYQSCLNSTPGKRPSADKLIQSQFIRDHLKNFKKQS